MARWFLSMRGQSVGGFVAPEVKVLDADQPGVSSDTNPQLLSDLTAQIRGRDVFFAVHGFEVNQADGITRLSFWLQNLRDSLAAASPGTQGPVTIGILWPGDGTIPLFVDYIIEGDEAISSGKLLAKFLNDNFTGAVTLSFASHSLGARVVLQTIRGLRSPSSVRRVLMMAGAIDNNCLTAEYKDVFQSISGTAQVSILASVEDDVLALAFPLGNPIQRIIDFMHPLFRAALGHLGPATPVPAAPGLQSGWQIPKEFHYGHHNYLPGQQLPAVYPGDVDIPPSQPVPPAVTPAALASDKNLWKPAFSAGFGSPGFVAFDFCSDRRRAIAQGSFERQKAFTRPIAPLLEPVEHRLLSRNLVEDRSRSPTASSHSPLHPVPRGGAHTSALRVQREGHAPLLSTRREVSRNLRKRKVHHRAQASRSPSGGRDSPCRQMTHVMASSLSTDPRLASTRRGMPVLKGMTSSLLLRNGLLGQGPAPRAGTRLDGSEPPP